MIEKVFIPKSINIESLLQKEKVDARKDYIENLRSGMIYFLGLLHRNDQNRYLFDHNGYRNLRSEYLNDIIGKGSGNKRRLNVIKEILIDKEIIEVKNYRQNVKSYGYRISSDYLKGEFNEYLLDKTIIDKLKKVKENPEQESFSKINGVDYRILEEQFERNEISFDLRVYDYLRDFTHKGLERTNRKTKYRKETYLNLLNYVGKLLNHIQQIEEKNFNLKVAESNGRFFSSVSSLPKILRPFLKINDENVCENDIMSSQSFILSSILTKNFTNDTGIGFNLNTIFNELLTEFRNVDIVNMSKNGGRQNFIAGVFFTENELKEIKEFHDIDFTTDFYFFVLEEGIKKHPDLMKKFPRENRRDFVKKRIMSFLFDNNDIFREENILTELIKNLYPAVNTYVQRFMQMYRANKLSLVLQRAEAFLILKVCEQLKMENVPFFTIHDSIITTEEFKDSVNFTMRNEIYKLTLKKVGVKSKTLIPLTEVEDLVLNEKFGKLNVTSKKALEKTLRELNNENIKTGLDFFYQNIKERSEMMNFLGLAA
jgi:hypothetical protein